MSIFRILRRKTRSEKAEDLDRMSAALHKRTSTRSCDLIRVYYDFHEEAFVAVTSSRERYTFIDRRACERFISSHYRTVRNLIDAGCHE